MNWISDLLSGNKSVNKEASITDAKTEFDKKLKASSWAQDVLSINEDELAKEAEAKLQADLSVRDEQISKRAAYDAFETTEETLKRDYQRDVEILSDSALSEMVAEIRGHNNQDYMENFKEYHEKAKKDVKSDRKAVEKEILENVGMSAQVDWKKSFKKYTDEGTPKQPKESDLYKDKLEKIDESWEDGKAKEKEYAQSDEEHMKSMQGVGRDSKERTDVTEQAVPVQKEAALVRDPDVELKVGTLITLARSVMAKDGTILPEGSKWQIKGIDGFHYNITDEKNTYTISSHDTPKFDKIASQCEIENHASKSEVLQKVAEIVSPWAVVTNDKGQEVIARVENEGTTKESEDVSKDTLQK